MEDIELRFQLELLKQERQPYINTRFVLQRRMRAIVGLLEQNILKESDDPKKPILDELVKIEAFIEQYDTQIAEIESVIKAESAGVDSKAKKNGHNLSVLDKEKA